MNTNQTKSNTAKLSKLDTCLPKPFLLLAGISGTGKTRFVKKQAECSGDLNETYCLTSVRPDWHEPSDLLGYVSRLSGQAEYVVTDVLKFIVKAWIEIEKFGITLNGNSTTGDQVQQQQVRPFWLCLDEMNLAPVEQYFADYLSVIETREWAWENNEFVYKCEPLLKSSLFDDVKQNTLKKALGLTDHEPLWQHFLKNGISIPFNLIVAGTVNMDETTHGFSRKVIDRALTFDFGEFFPNNFDEFFEPKNEPKVLNYPVWSDGRNKAVFADTFDSGGALSIALLESINTVLNNTPFKLAYRALNELLLSVMTNKPSTEIELQAVWDDFLMCKVLPRIEGDIDKLTKGGEDKNIIEQLEALLSEQLNKVWQGKIRPDLYRKSLDNDMAIDIECRSKAKLKWMSAQLDNGFTSFWP
ncbi:MAG: restriction endonuclease [Gammaproteobacteria bacterium]|nr:MAG: restriction endonuclease [Gammaproteobacteria bacterium]